MSFTNGKPFVVSEEMVATYKRFQTHELICAWCGRGLSAGDSARFVITNTGEKETEGLCGNPFICSACDGPRLEILDRLRATMVLFNQPSFRWFRGKETSNAIAVGEQREANYQARENR
jgi:hypothetical protein